MGDQQEIHDEGGGDRLQISKTVVWVVLAIIGWLISGFASYSAASGAMNARVSVLESQYQTIRSDISDIRTDVKTLLQRSSNDRPAGR